MSIKVRILESSSYCSGYGSLRIEFYCRKSKEPEKFISASTRKSQSYYITDYIHGIVLSNTIRAQILNRMIFPLVLSYFLYGAKLDLFGKSCSKTSTKIIRLNLSSYGIAPKNSIPCFQELGPRPKAVPRAVSAFRTLCSL